MPVSLFQSVVVLAKNAGQVEEEAHAQAKAEATKDEVCFERDLLLCR
jgi:hypothetical protein